MHSSAEPLVESLKPIDNVVYKTFVKKFNEKYETDNYIDRVLNNVVGKKTLDPFLRFFDGIDNPDKGKDTVLDLFLFSLSVTQKSYRSRLLFDPKKGHLAKEAL